MGVYVDIQGAQSRDSGLRGIGRYVAELAQALEEQDRGRLIAGYALNPELPVPEALAGAIAAERMRPSDQLALRPGDVYHVTSPFEGTLLAHVWPRPARLDGVRLAVTLYDLIPVIYPEHYLAHDVYRARYENRLGLVRNADRVLSISEATARDAIERLGVEPSAVTVAGTGVSARFRRPQSREVAFQTIARKVPGLRPEYVLYTGALDFRKNVDSLLVAYAELPAELRRSHQLLVVSRVAQSELDVLRRRLRQLDLTRDVRLARAISDDELVPLYQAAGLFVFPSLYEGFGLPAAEAIACGTPTIAGRTSSLVEIVRDPDAFFDPRVPQELAATMQRVLREPELRTRLAAAQLDERHSWSSVAERVLAAYAELGQSAGRRDRRTRRALAGVVAAEESSWSAGPAGAERGLGVRLVRALLWPLRRFFDPRFAGVDGHVLQMHGDLAHRLERAVGPGGALRRSNDALRRAVDRLEADRSAARADRERLTALLEEVREDLGVLRSGAAGEGAALVQLAFAVRAAGRLAPGARVLLLRPADGTVGLALASLGYDVTLLEVASAPSHPNLRAIDRVEPGERFDAVVCVDADAAGPALARLLSVCSDVERQVAVRGEDGSWLILGEDAAPPGAPQLRLLSARTPAPEPLAPAELSAAVPDGVSR